MLLPRRLPTHGVGLQSQCAKLVMSSMRGNRKWRAAKAAPGGAEPKCPAKNMWPQRQGVRERGWQALAGSQAWRAAEACKKGRPGSARQAGKQVARGEVKRRRRRAQAFRRSPCQQRGAGAAGGRGMAGGKAQRPTADHMEFVRHCHSVIGSKANKRESAAQRNGKGGRRCWRGGRQPLPERCGYNTRTPCTELV